MKEEATNAKREQDAGKISIQSAITENIHEAINMVRMADNKIIYTNRQFDELFGYKTGELLNQNVAILNAPGEKNSAQLATEIAHDLNQAGVWRGEIMNIRKDGAPIMCSVSVTIWQHPRFGRVGLSIHTDITKRRQAEQALKESQRQIELVLGAAKTGLDIIDRDYNIRYVDPAWAKTLGDWTGRKCHEYFLKLKTPCPNCEVAKAFASKKPLVEERQLNDGTGRYHYITSIPYQSKNGEWLVAQVNVDMTERHRAEEELKKSEAKFRALFHNASESMIIMSTQGKIMEVNNVALQRYGYSRAEFLEVKLNQLDAPGIPSEFEKNIRDMDRKGYTVFERVHLRKDGTRMPVEVSCSLIEYDGQPAMVATNRDITRRKEIEQALKKSEEKFRLLTEKSIVGIYIIQDSKIVYANESCARIFGYQPEEIIGQFNLKEAVHADDFPKVMKKIQERLAGKMDKTGTVYKGLKKDGSIIDIEVFGMLTEYQGQPAVMGTMMNITERRQAEAALKENEEKFRQLAEHSPNMIFINQAGKVIYANKICEETMGYTRQEIYSDKFSFLNLVAPESRDMIKAYLKKHFQGKEIPPYESRLITKAGRTIIAIHATKLIKIKGQPAILGVITDITELVQAREQIHSQTTTLKQKNLALKELLEQMSMEKEKLKSQMHVNLDKLVLPKLKRLKSKSDEPLQRQLSIIEQNIKSIDSLFGQKISARHHALSPREIEVCDMIRNGLKNKAIARELRLSFYTVETMRKNIRHKLRLKNKEVNLRTYLSRI